MRSLFAARGHGALEEIAAGLRGLAMLPIWSDSPWRAALPGEERLHEVAVAPGEASLYLVSDGEGVVSPPHGHGTWAVIAGIRGREANVLYREEPDRFVVPLERVVVGRGESLVLASSAIHSTEVLGAEPTFHLHLYGTPLDELESFGARVFSRRPG